MTTREHFERVRALFTGALERSAETRRAWLEEQCAGDQDLAREVAELLDRSDAGDRAHDVDGAPAAARESTDKNAFSDLARRADLLATPPRIGEYEILHVIGRGGMGTVYAAEQKHPRRRVALKVLQGGLMSERARRRFEYEGELLGRLRHPGIAHIYEAGVADWGFGPQPFLAMELVDGDPIARWIERSRPDTQRKLELFVELSLAVQHAHERGVIHRDLKPDNILVERDGRPKVLDFGIARAIESDVAAATRLTEAGAIVGTLSYMSPERLADDPEAIDTRSDVYSLGVILYELVSGTQPYRIDRLPIGKAIETIRFAEPAPLSETANVARDLSIIVAKAIDKDPERRYASVAALAEDVQRYLSDETITARPASTLYQVRKLVRRHRALAIGLTAVFLMLLLGLAGTMWQAHTAETRRQEADHERTIAEGERAKAEKNAAETKLVADFQSGLLANLSVDEFGHSLVIDLRQELAQRLAESGRTSDEIDKTLASFDDIVRPANSTNVAQRVLEERVFAPAVEKIEREYGADPLLGAMLATPLAYTLRTIGLYDLGVRAARNAVEARRKRLGDDDPGTLDAINELALSLREQGHPDEAEPLYRELVARRRAVLGDRHADTLSAIDDLALVLDDQGKFSEAEPLFEEAIAGQRATLGDTHTDTLNSISNLAGLRQYQGRLSESEQCYREALAGLRASLGDAHSETILAAANLAAILRDEHRLTEAEPLMREALAGFRVTLGDEHPRTLATKGNLGGLLREQGRLAEAEPFVRESLAGFRATLGDEHAYTLVSMGLLASLLQDQGKLADAESLFREALAGDRAKLGDAHPETLTLMNNLARLLASQHQLDESESLYRQALAGRRAALGVEHPSSLSSAHNLAGVLRLQGKLEEAEQLYRAALASRRATLGEGDAETLDSTAGLASVLQARGEFGEASELFEQAIQLGGNLQSNSERFVHDMRTRLRDVYRAWHTVEPSGGFDRKADEIDAVLGAH